jgi:hypothetical protein
VQTVGGANSHGYEAEVFGNITSRLSIIADWDFTTGSLTPYTNPFFSFAPGNTATQFIPNGITPPKTLQGHLKYNFADQYRDGFVATFGFKLYSPYMMNWQYPIYEYYSQWQYTLDAGVGFSWNHGKDSIYANVDNFTNQKVTLGIVQYYIMAPFEEAFVTYKRKF